MILAEIAPREFDSQLRQDGLCLRTGPIVTRIRSSMAAVRDGIALLYAQHTVEPPASFSDFDVSLERPRSMRRWINTQVVFRFDGMAPFAPLPGDQGFPLLEWGLNWCVSAHCHQYLIVHAAVLERVGRALILPAPSGSGKSTLCAALTFHGGWRLLSDELALFDTDTGHVVPLPRPVSLKNESIELMRDFAPNARFGKVVHETMKGRVAHLQPPTDAVQRAHERAIPAWVVLPRYEAGAPTQLAPLSRARAFMALVDNAFNYNVQGRAGFETLTQVIEGCACHQFTYSNLSEAVAAFDDLGRTNR